MKTIVILLKNIFLLTLLMGFQKKIIAQEDTSQQPIEQHLHVYYVQNPATDQFHRIDPNRINSGQSLFGGNPEMEIAQTLLQEIFNSTRDISFQQSINETLHASSNTIALFLYYDNEPLNEAYTSETWNNCIENGHFSSCITMENGNEYTRIIHYGSNQMNKNGIEFTKNRIVELLSNSGNFGDQINERATRRPTSSPSIPRRCRQKSFTIPGTYEEFENAVTEWMAGCVVTNSIRDDTGTAMNRHEFLVHGNPTLIQVWNRIRERQGDVLIDATHISNGHRTQEISFSDANRRIPIIEEPDDFEVTSINPPVEETIQSGVQSRPEIPAEPNPNGLFRGSLSSGLKYLIEGYGHTLGEQYDGLVYQSRLHGFLDSFARAAEMLDINNLQVRGSSLIRTTSPLPNDIIRNHGHPTYLEGYRQGRSDAYNSLRNLEQISHVEGPIRYQSTEMLLLLKSTYENNRTSIYNALRRTIPSR